MLLTIYRAIRRNTLGLGMVLSGSLTFNQYWNMDSATLDFLFDAAEENRKILTSLYSSTDTTIRFNLINCISSPVVRRLVRGKILTHDNLWNMRKHHLKSLEASSEFSWSQVAGALRNKTISVAQWISLDHETLTALNFKRVGGFFMGVTEIPVCEAIISVVKKDGIKNLQAHHFKALTNAYFLNTTGALIQPLRFLFLLKDGKFPIQMLTQIKPWMASVVNSVDFGENVDCKQTHTGALENFFRMFFQLENVEEWNTYNARRKASTRAILERLGAGPSVFLSGYGLVTGSGPATHGEDNAYARYMKFVGEDEIEPDVISTDAAEGLGQRRSSSRASR